MNQKSIEKILKDFYEVTSIRVLFRSYEHKTGTRYPPKSFETFCSLIRCNPRIEDMCQACDAHAFEMANQTGKVYVYQCHMGLTEAVAPVFVQGKAVGCLMMGQTLDKPPSEQLWQEVYAKCRDCETQMLMLRDAFMNIPYTSPSRIGAAAGILQMGAAYIYLSKAIELSGKPLVGRLEQFLEENPRQHASLQWIAQHFHVSVSYVSHKIKEDTGLSFTTYVNTVKTKQAKELLEMTGSSISQIAVALGYSDASYFSRVFKKIAGRSPEGYRKDILSKTIT